MFVRAHSLQVLDLVEDVEEYDREKPLVVAKTIGGREMAASVQSKLRLLKVLDPIDLKERTANEHGPLVFIHLLATRPRRLDTAVVYPVRGYLITRVNLCHQKVIPRNQVENYVIEG